MPPSQAYPPTPSVTSFFTQDEATTVDAIVARLIPGDAADPGAREAAVPAFIDTKLAQFASFATPTYFDAPFAKPVARPPGPQPGAPTDDPRPGSRAAPLRLPEQLDAAGRLPQGARRARPVHAQGARRPVRRTSTPARQDAVLEVLEAGKAGGLPQAKGFFKMVLEDTYEGMFADPSYGGNRGYAGWKLVGYPGAQRAYTADELQHGPQQKRVQGLRDMPAMNPGVPQDHVDPADRRARRPHEEGMSAMAIKHKRVDMVTIGAGWTAGMLAAKLCPNGTTMVSLEQGSTRWTWPHFAHDHDSLRYSVRYAMMVDLKRETWTWRPNPRSPALPMRQYGTFNPGMGLGGAAVHWSAQLWRYLEYDFKHRSHIVDRYGSRRSRPAARIQDWGITYHDLERYYDAFEWDIGASGQAGNINGKIIPGGNPSRRRGAAAIRTRR